MKRSLLSGAPVALALGALLFSACNTPVEHAINDVTEPIFSLNCPGVTPHAANVDTFLVIGHRGAAAVEVENTIQSFDRALADGANAIEIDLCMTSDGEIVLWHDWSPNDPIALAREGGGEFGVKFRPRFPAVNDPLRRPVDELTLREFRDNYWYATKNLLDKERVAAEIPTFQQFVEWAARQPKLYYVFLDMKVPADKAHLTDPMVKKMDSIMAHSQAPFKPVYITPHQPVWELISRIIDGAGLSFDVDLGGGLVSDQPCEISSSSRARQRNGGFATTMHPFVWTETPWTTLKKLLMCDLETRDAQRVDGEPAVVQKVIAATINSADKMECLVDMGIDGLMTDDPALLRSIAAGRGRKL